MASRADIERALRAADAAGNAADARRLAAALANMPPEGPSYSEQVQQDFAAMSGFQKPVQALDDMLRLGSNGLTFGFRDKLAGYLGGGTPEEERAKTGDAQIRAGGAGTMAELGGNMAGMMAVPNTAPAVAAKVSNPILRALATMGVGGLEGAGVGGIQAMGEDTPLAEGMASGAIAGAGGTAVAGLLSKGANAVANKFGKKSRLSVDDLKVRKNAAYQSVDDIGAEYTPGTIRGMLKGLDDSIDTAVPIRHDNTLATRKNVGKMVGEMTGKPVPLTQVDKARQVINRDLTKLPDAAEADFGQDMIKSMDDYLNTVGPLGVTARSGDPEEAIGRLAEARGLNSRMRKLEQITGKIDSAERRAARSLGTGDDSTIRQNIDTILNSPKQRRGFTPDELGSMDELVRGTTGQNTLRQMGRMAPGGGLSLAATGAGATAGTFIAPGIGTAIGGAIPSGVGFLAKKASERSTRNSTTKLMDLVASGGKKAKPKQVIPRDAEAALARLFMLQAQQD